MDNMIKFYRGLVSNLPAAGTNGALYITTDEGAIYYGTGTGMKRLGDFVQVDNVASLPEKAHESCLYYCVAENILAKWNGTEWKQINKQPTAEEMKTLLGLGSLAYLSEVTEDNLDSALKEKVNAAAEGNHSHSNKGVLDGITSDKVSAWDAAEQNAKDYADGLNTAMNGRVEALEAIDHSHTFLESELNKIVDGDVAKWNTAAGKAHEHTFVESELNKIVDGDVAKWNAVVADHLTSEDKTALENSIKEAKKAGTDANTNIEAYKVTNDARVLAVEEDIAEITGENGLLAQAKSYSDGKLATARTEISAEIDADVKVVADDLAGYKTSNDSALAGVKATAEAAATKTYTDAELAKKVDKVEGKDLIATSEITRLTDVHNYDDTQVKADIAKKADAETMTTELAKKVDKVEGKSLILDSEIERLAGLHNYDDTQVKADIAKKADTETMTTELGKKVDKVEGYSLVSDTEIARLAEVDNYDDEEVRGLIGDNAKAIEDLEGYVGTFTHDTAKTVVEYINAKTDGIATSGNLEALGQRVSAIEGDYLKEADIANFETKENVKKVADDLAAYVESNNAAVDNRYTKEEADGKFALIADAYDDAALSNRVKAIEDDYLVEADKTALQEQITANANAITLLTNGASAEEVDGVNDLIKYVKEHGTEVTGMKEDIAENAKAISDHEALAAETYETKTDAGNKLTEAKTYADGLNTAMDTRVKALEDHKDDYIAAVEGAKTEAANQDAVVLSEAQKYTDAAKDAAIADAASKYETIGTAQGIVDGLKLSETYEPIGAEGRAIAAAEGKVNALAGNVYTKEQTYTQEEVNSAIEAAVSNACSWGEF